MLFQNTNIVYYIANNYKLALRNLQIRYTNCFVYNALSRVELYLLTSFLRNFLNPVNKRSNHLQIKLFIYIPCYFKMKKPQTCIVYSKLL